MNKIMLGIAMTAILGAACGGEADVTDDSFAVELPSGADDWACAHNGNVGQIGCITPTQEVPSNKGWECGAAPEMPAQSQTPQVNTSGEVKSSVPDLSGAASGDVEGSWSDALPDLSGAASGDVKGSWSGALPDLSGAASGDVKGSWSGALPDLSGAASGDVKGGVTGGLPDLSGAASGDVKGGVTGVASGSEQSNIDQSGVFAALFGQEWTTFGTAGRGYTGLDGAKFDGVKSGGADLASNITTPKSTAPKSTGCACFKKVPKGDYGCSLDQGSKTAFCQRRPKDLSAESNTGISGAKYEVPNSQGTGTTEQKVAVPDVQGTTDQKYAAPSSEQSAPASTDQKYAGQK